MRHATAGAGIKRHFLRVHVHRMGKPHVWTYPIERFHISDGLVTEFLEAKSFFILGFGQVSVQMHAVLAR